MTRGSDIAFVLRGRAASPPGSLSRVLERIGVGGMGVVYTAYDPKLDRKIALKMLPGFGLSEQGNERLLREGR